MLSTIKTRKILSYIIIILAIIDNIYIYVVNDTYNVIYMVAVVFLGSYAIESLNQLGKVTKEAP